MRSFAKIESRNAEYVYTHMRVAHRLGFDHSFHLVIPWELNTLLFLFSDFGVRFLD
jgi:hypothetical protein